MKKVTNRIWFQAIVWIALFTLFFNIIYIGVTVKHALTFALYNTVCILFVYYFTIKYLFPNYYEDRKKFLILSIIFLVIITSLVALGENFLTYSLLQKKDHIAPFFFQYLRIFTQLGFTFFVGTSVSLFEQTSKLRENEKSLMEEKLNTELKLLKAQINPHFIFNALNNIYSLTYMKASSAPESVLSLSEMLRYVFYDCNKDRVPLSSEIKYIENFTAFQRMKSDSEQHIHFDIECDSKQVPIAPMLFIPFIENAFKYSRIEEDEQAFVFMHIRCDKKALYFNIRNSIPLKNKPLQGSNTGIKNVQHRLDIMYPGHYKLDIAERGEQFEVDLKLEF
jgi:two-component system LytT family sensor kinase